MRRRRRINRIDTLDPLLLFVALVSGAVLTGAFLGVLTISLR